MLNRDYVGHVLPPTAITVEAGQLRLFNKAVGEDRSIYVDEEAAKAAGFRSLPAPPTFATCLDSLAPETGPSFEDLGIDYRYLLHGGESFEYFAPMCAGDVITIETTVTNMYEKKGGALEFAEFETTFTNQLGELVQKRQRTLVMRYPQTQQPEAET